MSYINIIKRFYPLVLIACNALTVEPSKNLLGIQKEWIALINFKSSLTLIDKDA